MVDARPLAGIRVLELAKLLPSALITRRLATLGADVVKVEPPGGDGIRSFAPTVDGESVFHRVVDAGKRSVTVDLKTDEGLQALGELVAGAEIVVNGLSAEWLQARGWNWSRELTEGGPAVVCHVVPFGAGTPFATLPAHGMTIDALAGSLPLTWRDGEPRFPDGVDSSWAVELGVSNAVIGILGASLQQRAAAGRTSIEFEVSLWRSALECHRVQLVAALQQVEQPTVATMGPRYRPYETADDRVFVLATTEANHWSRFCAAVDRDDLLSEKSDEAIGRQLIELFRRRTGSEWLTLFEDLALPGGLVLTATDLMASGAAQRAGLLDFEAGNVRDPLDGVMAPKLEAGATRAPALGDANALLPSPWGAA